MTKIGLYDLVKSTTLESNKSLRAKGQRHGQALRNIGDRLLRMLVAMLRHRTCYDASRIRREPVVQMG